MGIKHIIVAAADRENRLAGVRIEAMTRIGSFRSGLAFALAFGLVSGAMSAAHAETTGSTGNGTPFSNYQPSLVLNQSIATGGYYGIDPGPNNAFIGMVHNFAGNFSPYRTSSADGRLLSIPDNPLLYSLIGTQYGWALSGGTLTHFALPDLAGKTAIGAEARPFSTIGYQSGTANVTLTQANLPAHDHDYAQGVTTMTGGNQAFDNRQPSLAMSYRIAVEGIYPSYVGGGGHAMIGEVGLFSQDFHGDGTWLPADGALLPISQFSTLFSIIGTTYGGDGIQTFALPDLVGRTIVGAGQGQGLGTVVLGERLGTDFLTLSENQMPAHDHALPTGGATDIAGGSQPVGNRQASLGLNYMVAIEGVVPATGGNGAVPENTPFLGEIAAFAGNFAPQGWAIADGRLLSIQQNLALFSVLGTLYGGNGITTFALPDLRGRSIMGAGGGFEVGQRIGSEWTYLTADNLAAHTHGYAFAQAVPEPATWTLMLAGFGAAGRAVRRRRAGQRIAKTA